VSGSVKGIQVQGLVAKTHVTGNLLWNCGQAALQIEELLAGSEGILVANNTAFDCGAALRVWDYAPYEQYQARQVELRNNLLFAARSADMLLMHDPKDGSGKYFPAEAKSLVDLWRFDHNWRDLSGVGAEKAIPPAPGDQVSTAIAVISRDPSDPDFLRPAKDSPLATDGAGDEDPSLPKYVGAVPPEGVEPWDWDKTWQTRAAGPPDDP